MASRLLVVQHAEKVRGPGDPGLTPAGRAQAEAVAGRLKPSAPAAVYSSPARRAVQTANVIAAATGLAVHVDDRLAERMNWADDGRPLGEFLEEWQRASRDRDHEPRWGQSSRGAAARMERVLLDLAGRHEGQTVIVVSHGGVTVDLARSLLGDHELEAVAPGVIQAGVESCAVTEILERGGRLRLVAPACTNWRQAEREPPLRPVTDGRVRLRPSTAADAPALVAGRDEEFRRFLGPGADEPAPTACVEVDGEVVGWVDYDSDRSWLGPGELNLGYNVFAPHRGQGYATRAVQLLVHHLAVNSAHRVATLLIDPENHRSQALAARAGFPRAPDLDGNPYFRRFLPPLRYSDGVVTVRPPRLGDLAADLEGKDEDQRRWLWSPEERHSWLAMSPGEQRTHAARGLEERVRAFGSGPKWTFSVDGPDGDTVAYIDCDLANDHVAAGEANISYASHPDHRGRGYVSRSVRQVLRFLADHTACREAHIVVDAENLALLRVPASLPAAAVQRWTTREGRTMIRHVLPVERTAGPAAP